MPEQILSKTGWENYTYSGSVDFKQLYLKSLTAIAGRDFRYLILLNL
ncbi:MAG: hypothetical protein QNJ55_25775 [Xenococcus sp. MO_188.B8]|nr:hypothetical protein [Xenococcus sp. MO_188.B8]